MYPFPVFGIRGFLFRFARQSEVRLMRSLLRVIPFFFCVFPITAAQEKTAPAKPTSAKAADLTMTAVGRQHHPIATKSKRAQDYFDQGITLIYAFNHEEAARSFQRAAELDPASPMPLWGIAMAVGPNYNMDVDAQREKLAFDTIQKAQRLAANAPAVERDYVDALAARYSGDAHPDYKKLARDYAAAMKALSGKYPDDLDAATFYAESLMNLNPWKLWSNDGKPGENTEEIVRVLESVLARNPMHAGANHYYIHAVEASPNPGRALPSAHRLDTLVPQAGHLVHMPAHIYQRTGFYSAAAKNNAEAARVDQAYAERTGQVGTLYDLMYHSHNQHFLAMSASMEGNYPEAKRAADAMAARLMPHAKMMPMLDGFIATPIWVDARFGKWQEILARPQPLKELPGTHALWLYSRTLAYAQTSKVADAEKERDSFAAEVAAFSSDAMFGEMNKARDVFNVATHVLEARIAAAKGKNDEAVEHWKQAVEIQDALNYDEPADWYYPVRESLGAALLNAGKPADAEQVFRADLVKNPRNPRSLFGLKEALTAQGKSADASWIARQFADAWKNAGAGLSLSDL
jgi:tetratricopeptide (TPR) repeat protein